MTYMSDDLRETCELPVVPSDGQLLATLPAVVENLTAGRVWDHGFDDMATHQAVCRVDGCGLCRLIG